MGFENDCILNIQSLAGEYFCAVCRTLVYPNEAIQTPCTHLYCKPCLSYVVSTTHACPYDGYRVTEADSKPLLESNKTLADTIGKIQVHCLYYRTGCTWQGPLSDCITHCPTCAFGESAVLCNRCGIQLKHRQVQEHAQNCSGVQSQVQQSSGVQDSTSAGAAAAPDQTQTAVQTGGSAPQVQGSQASTSLVSSQDANQIANIATQPQAVQAATLTPEQLYQQQQQQYQQQYQQYYQQYPGYDPYQQNYQYQQYYQQHPQATQQYQQQQTQAYGQPQPQGYGQVQAQTQAQTQPIVQAQQQVQPQVPSQGAQPPLQPQSQPPVNAQPQVPSVGQPQPQMQAQGQAPPAHAHPYNQAQAQAQPVAQQQLPVPQYPQTYPQIQQQHPHMQPFPQSQPQQHYSHPQPQVQSQPNMQAPVHPPQQPLPPTAQIQTPNAITGYQSYPQPQLHSQAQAYGAQYPSQMQGQFPSQTAQMRPPQSYSNVPNQQQPSMLSAQGQPLSGPSAQQPPVYPHAQQPGYPYQQRPSVQAAQQGAPQQYAQHQSFPGQGPYMQHQPPVTAQSHAQGPFQIPQFQQNYGQPPSAQPNVAQNYAGRPMGVQTVAHPYAQAAGLAGGATQVRPPQLNQNHPMKTSQLSSAEQQATQSQQVSSGEKPLDPMLEKGVHGQVDPSKEARNMGIASGAGNRGDEMKSKANNGLAESADGNNSKSYLSGPKQMFDADNKGDNHVQEAKARIQVDHGEGFPEPPSGDACKSGVEDLGDVFKKAEVQDLKHMAKNVPDGLVPPSLPKSHFKSQVHGSKLQPMPYGPPAASSVSQSMAHPGNSQPALPGHPSNQLRPQGPGQAPSSAFPPENPSGGIPGNLNYYQGNLPPHQAGQPQKPPGDPLVGPSYTGHRPGASRHEIEKFAAHRSGHFDGRKPDVHPHGPIEQTSFGPGPHGIQPGTMKFGGPPAHDSMLAPGRLDERGMPFVEDNLKPFSHREFENDFRKFPRPHLKAGPPSNNGMQFPSSWPLDRGSGMFGGDGMLRPFDKEPHGFDRDSAFKMDGVGSGPSRLLPNFHPKDVGERPHAFPDDDMRRADFRRPDLSGRSPGSGFGHHHMDGLPLRSSGRDYPGFPSRSLGPYGDVGGNDSRPFEGSKPFNFPGDPFGKPPHERRFPVPPPDDLDIPGNLRRGEHLGFRSLPLGEASAFGRPGELSRMERHIPFGDSFGGEKIGLPLGGDPGFRGGFGFPRQAHDGGFHSREMEPFDNLRKRKPGSIMCLICKIECGSVEGLDLHSQSREHQRKARDMVLSIKQQNKKQKMSRDQAHVEEGRDGGRPKNMGFQGRGNKR